MFSIYIQFGRRFGTPNIICKSDWHMRASECGHAVRYSIPLLQFVRMELTQYYRRTVTISFECWVARTNVGSHSKNVKSYFTYTETVRHTHQHPAHTCHITDNLNCAESSEVHSSVFPWCRTNDSDDDIRWGYRTVATNTEHIRV